MGIHGRDAPNAAATGSGMKFSRHSFWLLLRTLIIVVVLTVAYLLLVDSAAWLVPSNTGKAVTPARLPTYGLSPTILARVNAVSHSPYICPVADISGPVEAATCTDCFYYPVDKVHKLPEDYVPSLVDTDLPGGGKVVPVVKGALTALFTEAHRQGFSPRITSAYRSYAEQVKVFDAWVAQEVSKNVSQDDALANAGRYSARPGHSEHQLGTAVDLNCEGCVAFDDHDQKNLDLWNFLEIYAHHYGFVISYPRDIEALTGYMYEPWHLRYVGISYATKLYSAGYLNGSGACLLGLLHTIPTPTAVPITPTDVVTATPAATITPSTTPE